MQTSPQIEIEINKEKTNKTKMSPKRKLREKVYKTPLGLFCVGQLLLGLGPGLKCGQYVP